MCVYALVVCNTMILDKKEQKKNGSQRLAIDRHRGRYDHYEIEGSSLYHGRSPDVYVPSRYGSM